MGFLGEFLPIVIFLIIFKCKGLTVATIVAIIIALLQLAISKFYNKKYNLIQIISLGSLSLCGILAIVFKQESIIKWKPTAIYWSLALVLLVSPFWVKNILLSKLHHILALPQYVVTKLKFLWVAFFIFMGCLNLFIVYNFDTNTWVYFKLFGTLLINVIFVGLQGIFIYKYTHK